MINKGTSIFLRGVGVFFVILAHYSQWYLTISDNNIVWLLSKTGRYGVAIFFMVSGYGLVFSAKKGMNANWICRRIYHVYFPYLCIQGVIYLLEKRSFNSVNITRYIFSMDTWFIFVILNFYVLFYIVWKFSGHKIQWMALGVTVISVILAVAGQDSVWYSSNFAFLIGIIAARYDEKIGRWILSGRRSISIVLLASFLCSGVFYTYFTDKSELIYVLGKIVASLLWSLLILTVFAYREMSNKMINKIGAASLEIYLIHIIVLQRLGLERGRIGVVMVLLISLLVSLIIAEILHKFFKNLAVSYRCIRRKMSVRI